MDSELLLKFIAWVFPRLPLGIVAYAFTLIFGQLLSKQLYTPVIQDKRMASISVPISFI